MTANIALSIIVVYPRTRVATNAADFIRGGGGHFFDAKMGRFGDRLKGAQRLWRVYGAGDAFPEPDPMSCSYRLSST